MKKIMEESRLCQQIVREAHDAIIVADREGTICFWNQGAEMIFGFNSAAALGQSLHLIIPANLRARHDQGYRQGMQTGRSKYASTLLAVPALKRDGTRISVEFTLILLRGDQEQILGAAAIIRDVSLQWEQNRALQRRLVELEAQIKLQTSPGGFS